MFILWDEELASRNEEINNQHKEMFIMFNNFQSVCMKENGQDDLTDQLNFLNEYIKIHFEPEEHLLLECDYMSYLKHREEHEGCLCILRKLEEQLRIKKAASTLLFEIKVTIVNLLTLHITWSDKHLLQYMNSAMLKHQKYVDR